MQLTSLQDVLVDQIKDLQSAEEQLIEALPKMAGAASTDELRQAFNEHLEETREHARRLEQVASQIGISGSGEECEAMKGLIKEGDKVIQMQGDPAAKDAALIAAAQRVEHYEIAAYGTARTLAEELDYGDAASLLSDTLDEESAADTLLTRIATGGMLAKGVNQRAQ